MPASWPLKKKIGGIMGEVANTAGNFAICMDGNCSACPSYPHIAGEGLYCAGTVSKAKIKRKGCNCPGCAVWTDDGPSRMYYCAGASQ